jgi:hypothetical protein
MTHSGWIYMCASMTALQQSLSLHVNSLARGCVIRFDHAGASGGGRCSGHSCGFGCEAAGQFTPDQRA